jgi:hypothetical protein
MALPAISVADPLAVKHVACPNCGRDTVTEDLITSGRGTRCYCHPYRLRLYQEARRIPGRRT